MENQLLVDHVREALKGTTWDSSHKELFYTPYPQPPSGTPFIASNEVIVPCMEIGDEGISSPCLLFTDRKGQAVNRQNLAEYNVEEAGCSRPSAVARTEDGVRTAGVFAFPKRFGQPAAVPILPLAWESANDVHELPRMNASDWSEPHGVSRSGVIVGGMSYDPVWWEPNGEFRRLSNPKFNGRLLKARACAVSALAPSTTVGWAGGRSKDRTGGERYALLWESLDADPLVESQAAFLCISPSGYWIGGSHQGRPAVWRWDGHRLSQPCVFRSSSSIIPEVGSIYAVSDEGLCVGQYDDSRSHFFGCAGCSGIAWLNSTESLEAIGGPTSRGKVYGIYFDRQGGYIRIVWGSPQKGGLITLHNPVLKGGGVEVPLRQHLQ